MTSFSVAVLRPSRIARAGAPQLQPGQVACQPEQYEIKSPADARELLRKFHAQELFPGPTTMVELLVGLLCQGVADDDKNSAEKDEK